MALVFQCLRERFGVRFWQGFQWLTLTTFACTSVAGWAGHRAGAQGTQPGGQSTMGKPTGWPLTEIRGRPARGQGSAWSSPDTRR